MGFKQKSVSILKEVIITVFIMVFMCGTILITQPKITEGSGTQLIGELEIGERIVDINWEWEYKLGHNYSDNVFGEGETEVAEGTKEPVTWIVIGKNHYSNLPSHVTLLAENLIARHCFDNSTNRGSSKGSNHWGDSGSDNATNGMRKFLNNTFYGSFSEMLKSYILPTNIPNSTWQGNSYTTKDRVFILSQTELGGGSNETYPIGSVLSYFNVENVDELHSRQKAQLPGLGVVRSEDSDYRCYWTRSPYSGNNNQLRRVAAGGDFGHFFEANFNHRAARPVINIVSQTPVTVSASINGAYEINEMATFVYGDLDLDGDVSVTDAILVLRFIVGLVELSDYQIERAKVANSDTVSVQDAINILRYTVELVTELPPIPAPTIPCPPIT